MANLQDYIDEELVKQGLGTLHDDVVSQRTGMDRLAIAAHRRRLGMPIPEKYPRKKRRKVSDDLLIANGIGKESDAAVGKKVGLSTCTIWLRRVRMGLPSSQSSITRVTDEKLLELGLGKVSDTQVARNAGVLYQTVRMRRVVMGIPAVSKNMNDIIQQRLQEQKERYLNAGMGQKVDDEVGEALGVTRQRVEQVRKRWNIPQFSKAFKAKERAELTDQIKSLADKGRDTKEIAKACRVVPATVSVLSRAAGFKVKRTKKPYMLTREQVLEAVSKSETLGKAADLLNIWQPSICRYINEFGLRDEVNVILLTKGYTPMKNGRLYPPDRELRVRRGYRNPISKEQVLEAIRKSPSMTEAARSLGLKSSDMSPHIRHYKMRDEVNALLVEKGWSQRKDGSYWPGNHRHSAVRNDWSKELILDAIKQSRTLTDAAFLLKVGQPTIHHFIRQFNCRGEVEEILLAKGYYRTPSGVMRPAKNAVHPQKL